MVQTKPTALLLVLAVAFATFAPLPAAAAEPPPAFAPDSIVFPVIGEVAYTDTFGAPRSGHSHDGIDIMSADAVKGRPVVAAADGVVDWIGGSCCYLSIDHGGGWETWYVHLNNDSPGTDDGLGWGIADGIEVGTPVAQGQVIGWVGDSGNAESAGPHLHFEIRQDGTAINPYDYLIAAPVLDEAGQPKAAWTGQFRDDDASVHQANIDIMFAQGITKGCNPPTNDLYCPTDLLTRGQVAAFLRRNLALPMVEEDFFADDGGSVFEADINALTAAGIGFGCTTDQFCADVALTRGEMAEYLVRSYGFANPDATDFFTDDATNAHQDAINALFANGITVGCSQTEALYCPEDSLTREQMATFLARSLNLGS